MRFVLSFAFFILPVLSFAELKVPRLNSPVIDEARLIGLRERDELISEIRDYRQRGGAQVAVLTVEDLGGLTVEEASIKIAERWKLGTEKSDQGLLVLISKKERAVRIEVGQGLEGVLPDVQVKRIIEDIMIPYFRDGKFGRGVHEGLVRAAELIDPKVPFYSGYQRDDRPNVVHMPPFFKFLFFLFMIFLFFKFPFLFVGGGRGHRYGGSSWGGGNWGGGSGGWSGGGGGFSGGGASGRW
ncbi:MAG: hypothetical protein A4S09_07825 [Proteobacteria bacterium SG_bin7]|nr:MAG: hypothetical protein A4S09_07825 [Proteobacteria bacterium SG_bin7]